MEYQVNSTDAKLDKQFSHLSQEKLLQLTQKAVKTWSNNKNLKEVVMDVSKKCTTCKLKKKGPPSPVTGFPMATQFQENNAMERHSYSEKFYFALPYHHCTCLSASVFFILHYIMLIICNSWMSMKLNLLNANLLKLCEALGITVKTIAAESSEQ